MFRTRHIKDNTIAMVPVHGYVNSTRFSPDSIRWLDHLMFVRDLFIHHALNGLGEKKIAGISVDGFCSGSNTVYQYHVSSIKFFNNSFIMCYNNLDFLNGRISFCRGVFFMDVPLAMTRILKILCMEFPWGLCC